MTGFSDFISSCGLLDLLLWKGVGLHGLTAGRLKLCPVLIGFCSLLIGKKSFP